MPLAGFRSRRHGDEGLTSWTPSGPGNAQTCPRCEVKSIVSTTRSLISSPSVTATSTVAWQLKMTTREGAVVQWRIQQVIDRVKERAAEKNMPPEMIEMVGAQWRNMIGWFVQFEEEKLRQAQDAAEGSGAKSGS